jgi:hypothetical protein
MKLSCFHHSHSPWKSPLEPVIPHIPTARLLRLYNDIFALQAQRHFSFAATMFVSAM